MKDTNQRAAKNRRGRRSGGPVLRQNKPEWKAFEEAVATFVKTLDPTAKVEYNKWVPSILTGELRQADAWIEQRVCNLFPAKILVSCKDHGRKLGSRDIDTFRGEVTALGATFGVIYTRRGFYKPAIEAAKKLGVVCCRLYRDQPPDIPQVTRFFWFACRPRFSVHAKADGPTAVPLGTWREFLTNRSRVDGRETTIAEELGRQVHLVQSSADAGATANASRSSFPAAFSIEIRSERSGQPSPTFRVTIDWDFFRARTEACIVNGSYCHIDDLFTGKESSPAYDIQSFPGEGWERLPGMPDETPMPSVIMTFQKGNVSQFLLEELGDKPFLPYGSGEQGGDAAGGH